MPINGNVKVTRSVLPSGVAGVDATVKKMVQLAHSTWGSKSKRIRFLAMDIVNRAGISSKDYYGEIVAIHNWVRDKIRYFRDPVGQETLADPEQTAFNLKGGDCDDMTILEIALLGAIGISAYPVVVGTQPDNYSHVYLYAMVPAGSLTNAGMTVPLDPIMKQWPAGREADASKIKAKKTYPQYADPSALSGASMGTIGHLGGYAVGPSYLDTEESHATELLSPDKQSCYMYADKTVANGVRATQPMSGIDAMMGARVVRPVLPPGATFTNTSPGDGGTVLVSAGQLVPNGFLRAEPDLQQTMTMSPASDAILGPRGPIQAWRANQEHAGMARVHASPVPSIQKQLAANAITAQGVPTVVGQKRYEIPSAAQASREQRGHRGAYGTHLMDKPNTYTLHRKPNVKLGQSAMPQTLHGALGHYTALAGALGDQIDDVMRQMQNAPVAVQDNGRAVIANLQQQKEQAETQALGLKQALNRKGLTQRTLPNAGCRCPAVQAQERAVAQNDNAATASAMPWAASPGGVNGLAGVITDTLESPFVYIPLIALVGVVAWKATHRKKRK